MSSQQANEMRWITRRKKGEKRNGIRGNSTGGYQVGPHRDDWIWTQHGEQAANASGDIKNEQECTLTVGEEKFESSALESYGVEGARSEGSEGEGAAEVGLATARHSSPSLEAPSGSRPARLHSPQSSGHFGRQSAGISSRQAAIFIDGEVLTFPVIQHTLVCFTFPPSLLPHCELH